MCFLFKNKTHAKLYKKSIYIKQHWSTLLKKNETRIYKIIRHC